MNAVELDRVVLREADDGGVGDVHSSEGPRAHVLHELLDVLLGDGGRDLELQYHRVIHLQVQTPHVDGDGARHGEDIHLGQTRDAPVVQVDLQHALVEGFGRAGFVLLYDAVARLLDDAHEGGALEAGLQGLGPGHGEEEEGGEVSHRGVPRVLLNQIVDSCIQVFTLLSLCFPCKQAC